MLEACLRILFTSKDLSSVKDYCVRQWGKILSNRVSVQVGGARRQGWGHVRPDSRAVPDIRLMRACMASQGWSTCMVL